jgi:hypothetical protein
MDRYMKDSSTVAPVGNEPAAPSAALRRRSNFCIPRRSWCRRQRRRRGSGKGEAVFMSLQALCSGACSFQTQPQPVAASVRVRDLTVQVDYHRTNNSSSGDSSGGAPIDHDTWWSPHTARA